MVRAILGLVVALASAPPAAAQAPPLPHLELDSYPAATRDAIAPALKNASARDSDPAVVGALGRVLQAWEQYAAADQAYQRAEALAPRAAEWHYLDGVVLRRLARHADAAVEFAAAAAADPSYLPARVARAEALLEAGDLDAAAAAFDALAAAPLARPQAEFGLGRIEAARGRHPAAIAHFEKAIALFPEWGAAHYALAQSYRATGRLDDARRALERHAQYGPRWPGLADPLLAAVTALRDDAQAALRRGLDLAAAGDVQGAITAHEAAVRIDPDLAQAHANLINLYARLRDWDKAAEQYRATVALGYNLAEANYDYALLLGLQQQWDDAEAAYRRAIAVNPFYSEAHNNLGQLLERRQAFEAAADEYKLAVDANSGFRIARFNLGRMLIGLGRPQQAVVVLEPIEQPRDAESPRYMFALATALVRAGRVEEGARWATEARRLALDYRQTDLAQAIERDLAQLK